MNNSVSRSANVTKFLESFGFDDSWYCPQARAFVNFCGEDGEELELVGSCRTPETTETFHVVFDNNGFIKSGFQTVFQPGQDSVRLIHLCNGMFPSRVATHDVWAINALGFDSESWATVQEWSKKF